MRLAKSLVCLDSSENLKFYPKISGQRLGNSRFVEMGSGDRFDLWLCDPARTQRSAQMFVGCTVPLCVPRHFHSL